MHCVCVCVCGVLGATANACVLPACRLISHCHLGGALAPKVLSLVKGSRMVEASCFTYLNELRDHLLAQHARRSTKRPQEPRGTHEPQPKRPSNAAGKRPQAPPLARAQGVRLQNRVQTTALVVEQT